MGHYGYKDEATERNIPNLFIKTLVIVFSYVLVATNCVIGGVICTVNGIKSGIIAVGIVCLVQSLLVVLDSRAKERDLLAAICAVLEYFILTAAIAWILEAKVFILIVSVEIILSILVIVIIVKVRYLIYKERARNRNWRKRIK